MTDVRQRQKSEKGAHENSSLKEHKAGDKKHNGKHSQADTVAQTRVSATAPATPSVKSTNYWIDLGIITFVVIVTFFKLIWRIGTPQDVVWDETHFTKFSTWYYTGHYFVDIHPPLAKLIMAIFIWFSNYQPLNEANVEWWTARGFVGTMDYVNIYKGITYVIVREASLLVGIMLVVATYLTLRALGCRRLSSFFGTWMMMTDCMITLYSRLILTDIYLWFFHVATIGASFASVRQQNFLPQLLWYVATGFLLGCTVSCKYTAFGTIGFVGVHQAVNLVALYYRIWLKNRDKAPEGFTLRVVMSAINSGSWKALVILGIATTVFLSVWTIHMEILPYQGQGDGFMDPEYNKKLIPFLTEAELAAAELGGCPNHANAWYDCGFPTINQAQCEERGCCWDSTSKSNWCYPKLKPTVEKGYVSWWYSIQMILQATWKNNQGEELRHHPNMSSWYEWPLLLCRLVDYGFGIYSIGNIVVWWLAAASMAISLVILFVTLPGKLAWVLSSFVSKTNSNEKVSLAWPNLFVFVVGYLGNWAPFYFITRSTWNYHYMLALLIAVLAAAYLIELLLSATESNTPLRVVLYIIIAALMIAMGVAFWYWAPWVYGLPLPLKDTNARRWHHWWTLSLPAKT